MHRAALLMVVDFMFIFAKEEPIIPASLVRAAANLWKSGNNYFLAV